MKWHKQALVYGPSGESSWAKHSALQPTPYVKVNSGVIRVFSGFRDNAGTSRVGYVDVDATNPSSVLGVSKTPVLDLGIPGTFDENGVVPCAIVERDDKLYLFYAGYQLGQKVKFYVFSGVAVSVDGGETFERHSNVPICERRDGELFFRVIHTMLRDGDRWRAWYGGGSSFDVEDGKQYPRYNIRHAESPDGLHLDSDYQVCLDMDGSEYRLGRPYVIKDGDLYRMFYGASTRETGYRLAYAESSDGINWLRKDDEIGISVSSSGWDSQMQAYPSIASYNGTTYMFYNGNDYGRDGFGYAVLEHW